MRVGVGRIGVGSLHLSSGQRARYVVTRSDAAPIGGEAVTISAQLVRADGTNDATAGVVVTWTEIGGSGDLSAATSLTDAGGLATVTLTVGSLPGHLYAVRATDAAGRTGVSGAIVVAGSAAPVYWGDLYLGRRYYAARFTFPSVF